MTDFFYLYQITGYLRAIVECIPANNCLPERFVYRNIVLLTLHRNVKTAKTLMAALFKSFILNLIFPIRYVLSASFIYSNKDILVNKPATFIDKSLFKNTLLYCCLKKLELISSINPCRVQSIS